MYVQLCPKTGSLCPHQPYSPVTHFSCVWNCLESYGPVQNARNFPITCTTYWIDQQTNFLFAVPASISPHIPPSWLLVPRFTCQKTRSFDHLISLLSISHQSYISNLNTMHIYIHIYIYILYYCIFVISLSPIFSTMKPPYTNKDGSSPRRRNERGHQLMQFFGEQLWLGAPTMRRMEGLGVEPLCRYKMGQGMKNGRYGRNQIRYLEGWSVGQICWWCWPDFGWSDCLKTCILRVIMNRLSSTARPRLIFLDLSISGKFPDIPDAHWAGADMIMVYQVYQLTSCWFAFGS